ncbi:MAG: hypothetical protein WC587_03395 [Candidatus Paceibacterota bacterium]
MSKFLKFFLIIGLIFIVIFLLAKFVKIPIHLKSGQNISNTNISVKPIGSVNFNNVVETLENTENYVYAGLLLDPFGKSNEFSIVDVFNPSNPYVVSGIRFGNSVNSIKVIDSYAYLGLSSGGGGNPDFLIIDISTPSTPKIVGQLRLGVFIDSMVISGRYAYVGVRSASDKQNEIMIVDISNPTNPTVVSKFWYKDIYNSIAITSINIINNYAYVTLAPSNETNNNFLILDISNPTTPKIISSNRLVDFPIPIGGIKFSGNYAYIGLQSKLIDTGNKNIKKVIPANNFIVADVSNPAVPKIVKEIKLGSDDLGVRSLYMDGNYIYVGSTHGDDPKYKYQDFIVVNITNPLDPVVAKYIEVGNAVINSISANNGYIYLGTIGREDNMIILNKKDFINN